MSPVAEKRLDDAIKETDEALTNGTAKLYDNVDEMFDDILRKPDEL